MTTFGAVTTTTVLDKHVVLIVDNFRKGGTAPTEVTIGTSPAVPALLFDATAELASFSVFMPDDWDKGDINLEMEWAIMDTSVVASATLDLTLDYLAIDSDSHDLLTKTSTQVTGQITAVSGSVAIDSTYRMVITLSAADGTNPFTTADFLCFEMHLTNVSGWTGGHFLGAEIDYVGTH